ncbi:MAG: endo-1,4-beta-xylanase [Brevundimonas sp.]
MISRRTVLASSLALPLAAPLAACDRTSAEPTPPAVPSLKSVAPCPFGTAIKAMQIDDPDWVALARANVSQLTPEWEMKMEYVLADGLDRPRFDRTDRIAAFAAAEGMALHGHTLIWYSQGKEAFEGLSGAAFDRAFDGYIAAMAGRYRGKVRSWDVVNEPILDDGSAMRDCHWSARYGHDGYILRAFEQARIADPEAVLFLNEYNQESIPAKGAQFLRLVERLLKAGCPLQGLGLQSHLWIDIPEGVIAAYMREIAQFGLPIHVSELDCTLRTENPLDLRSQADRLARQSARVTELAGAFTALPPAQRFAFTVWGLRDTRAWRMTLGVRTEL